MGLHTGHVERRATGYVGLEIHRAARVASAAHGGQVLVTDAVRALAGDGVQLDDLGRHRLKDFPSPEHLHCAVIDGEGAAAFPPPRTLQIRPTNLPADDRALIGRDDDLAAVVAAFERERLVTLTGMGGTGKTRLALAAGAALLDANPGGVWWVPLAAATDPGAVLAGLAGALHVEDDGSRPLQDLLATRVGDRPTLAAFDNLEQLGAAGADAIAGLLAVAPGLRVLATSQSPLRLTAERVIALEPLDPLASRELFAAIAGRTRAGIVLDDAVVDELCERLDHLPLAIELAAGRLSVLTPAQVLERLSAPLKLLKGGERDRPERQRSLRATIDWTLGLLEREPRALFTRLGAFAGAVELEDIEAVCEDDEVDVLEAVAALLDAGILRRREDGSGAIRLRLPEALRQVARDELDASPERDRWRRAHAEYLADATAGGIVPMAATADGFQRARALDPEVRQALDWAWANDPQLAALIGSVTTSRWIEDGRVVEAHDLSERIMAMPELPPEVRAGAMLGRVYVCMVRNDAARGRELCERVRELLGPEHELHRYARLCELWLSTMAAYDARPAADSALALVREHGAPRELATALVLAFQAHLGAGDTERAQQLLEEGSAVARASGAKMLWHLDTCWGDLALIRGDAAEAASAYVRSMTGAAARADLLQVFLDLLGLAASLAEAARYADAVEAQGMAEALSAETGVARSIDVPGADKLAAAPAVLGPEATEAAMARGRAVPLGRRVERAAELAEAAAVPAAG
jgi:predicted ATPase